VAVRPIVQIGDPVLKQVARKVHRIDDGVKRLIEDMVDSLHEVGGIGLAAPQIGVPLRVVITDLDDEFRIIVNPEIVWIAKETETADEACLSIIGYTGPVERSLAVDVRALDERGKKIRIKAQDWFARCLQHEVDHLNGILYTDHIEDKSLIRRVTESHEVEPEGEEPHDSTLNADVEISVAST
jgi:peptide deformylase